MNFDEILQYQLFKIGNFDLTPADLLGIVFIYIMARLVLFLTSSTIRRIASKRGLDRGREASMVKLVSYLMWVVAILVMMDLVGLKPTLLLASSAALLVGLGLGLQDIFSDVISGVFLLFEGTIKVGDILEVDGMVGRVEDIHLRTSQFRNRDDISMIIPHRMFMNENVVNWSHNEAATRFHVAVGVAYKSDVNKVRDILLDVASQNPEVLSDEKNRPTVRLSDFGSSSLDFELLFYSKNMFRVENTKSDLRFAIRQAFFRP
ncbi:MAG: mechanosensitive ion channel [Lewinellaceae bacterium]|nr:mechanosensitive ion channel [Lewinellaceae bacterium]